MARALPNAVTPRRYVVSLHLAPDLRSFRGQVTISLPAATAELALHAKDLDIGDLSDDFGLGSSEELGPEVMILSRRDGTPFSSVSIPYRGAIGDGETVLEGLYRSSWTDEGGNSWPLVVSQCEAKEIGRAHV